VTCPIETERLIMKKAGIPQIFNTQVCLLVLAIAAFLIQTSCWAADPSSLLKYTKRLDYRSSSSRL
jgi:hypothetical protein